MSRPHLLLRGPSIKYDVTTLARTIWRHWWYWYWYWRYWQGPFEDIPCDCAAQQDLNKSVFTSEAKNAKRDEEKSSSILNSRSWANCSFSNALSNSRSTHFYRGTDGMILMNQPGSQKQDVRSARQPSPWEVIAVLEDIILSPKPPPWSPSTSSTQPS